jgi:hypothetical protein
MRTSMRASTSVSAGAGFEPVYAALPIESNTGNLLLQAQTKKERLAYFVGRGILVPELVLATCWYCARVMFGYASARAA